MIRSKKTKKKKNKQTRTLLKLGKLRRETESLRIATKNNAIRTHYIKSRIDKTQKITNIVCDVIETK